MENGFCFVCDLPRGDIEATNDTGFDGHIEKDHNQWHYVFLMYSLRQKQLNSMELTGAEIQFANMWNSDQLNHIWPHKRANCVDAANEGQNRETDMEKLLNSVEKMEFNIATLMVPTLQTVTKLTKQFDAMAKMVFDTGRVNVGTRQVPKDARPAGVPKAGAPKISGAGASSGASIKRVSSYQPQSSTIKRTNSYQPTPSSATLGIPGLGEQSNAEEGEEQAEIDDYNSVIKGSSANIKTLKDTFDNHSQDGTLSKGPFMEMMKHFQLKYNLIDLNIFFGDGPVTWDQFVVFMGEKKQRRDSLIKFGGV